MRAKPFSNKQKKLQLQEKRQRKAHQKEGDEEQSQEHQVIVVNAATPLVREAAVREIPAGRRPNKLLSQWDTIGVEKKMSPYENPEYVKPIRTLNREALEVSFESVHGSLESAFSIPSRPVWSYEMSREELEVQEAAYFQAWLQKTYDQCPRNELSFFEHNLEVWRQLWRVCEMSEIIVIVVDARHPVLNFPPSLHRYVVKDLGKKMVISLTKADMVGERVVEAWRLYISSLFPDVIITTCSIYSLEEKLTESRPKRYVNAHGVANLISELERVSDRKFENEWRQFKGKRAGNKNEKIVGDQQLEDKEYLTIGFIGHPNAGKSSLINSVVGRKCVSASRTPGHTKHFQTIHLTKHIRLCDCPGLIFPMRIQKWLQILAGLYNIAQVRDPYEPLMHLASHIDLVRILGLPQGPPRNILQICQEYAEQRGFLTAKAARPDVYRAANLILRGVVDGRILLCWKPPAYYQNNPIDDENWSAAKSMINVEEHVDEEVSESSSDNASSSEMEENGLATGVSGGAFSLLSSDDEDQ